MTLTLKIRTEYSFKTAFGRLDKIIERCADAEAICIADRHGTWGHVAFSNAMKAAGKKPVFGVELACVRDASRKERQPIDYTTFIARNNNGLKEIYELVTKATEHFYYHPRIDYDMLAGVGGDIIVIADPSPSWLHIPDSAYFPVGPSTQKSSIQKAKKAGHELVAVSDNYYIYPDDVQAYEIVIGNRGMQSHSWSMHILDEEELQIDFPDLAPYDLSRKLLSECDAELPTGTLVKFKSKKTLEQLCNVGAKKKKINLTDPVYKARLKVELDLIHEKEFENYFYVIADMLAYAKKHMLVGPARGSSCGSLVCYLLDITSIDPIPFDLLFERFIDVNRADLPDIDIDFPDSKRDMVFEYLTKKYGDDCVARLGTVSKFKAKSTIGEVSKQLRIPYLETEDVKNAIIERSAGDSRAAFCIMDTFTNLEVGKRFIEKYPQMKIAERIEQHSRHSGQHAAGVIVTDEPIKNYCSVDNRVGVAMIDKYDAEKLNLLKIDALGLRTLSIVQETLESIDWPHDKLIEWPTDDTAAFKIINDEKFAGVFQFEGMALQALCKKMKVKEFEDIVSLTALARPGPLISGGATEFLYRHDGRNPVIYLHALTEQITKVTYGVVVYQEQVMQIARNIGKLSWGEVSELRKAMSKSLGKEYFDTFWVRFAKGAAEQGIAESEALNIWEKINTMGSWAFNRSHAVAYGMVSYWCCVLKAHAPLEFAAATLRHAKDTDQVIHILRELVNEGYGYSPFDPEHPSITWSVSAGKITGGLLNIKGIGPTKAKIVLAKLQQGHALSAAETRLLDNPVTPYDTLYEADDLWGDMKRNPSAYNISSRILDAKQITDQTKGDFAFIGKLKEKNISDSNDLMNLQKRGGKRIEGQSIFLNLKFEDDTDVVMAQVSRFQYLQWGKPIVEEGKIGDWYLIRGYIRPGFRKIYVRKCKKLTVKNNSQTDEINVD